MDFEPKKKVTPEEQYYGIGGFILEIIKVFVLALVIILPVRVFLFQPFFVQGASMEPNFENNQYLIINEFGYKQTAVDVSKLHLFTVNPFRELTRQEVAVFRYPKNRSQFFIKRIIGLPGERVQIKDGTVTIFNQENPDGIVLDESAYLSSEVKTQGEAVTALKDNEYFVMGDNRGASSDSRSWGPVKEADIVGKVLLRAWPLDQLSIF
ncbi:MAG: signal peptidase I [Parcubacteria group bacterium]